jgi:hypothetical protein
MHNTQMQDSQQFEKELLREISDEESENDKLQYLNEESTPREVRKEFKALRGKKNWPSLVIKISFMDNISNELTKDDIQCALDLLGDVHNIYSALLKEYCDDIIEGRDVSYVMMAVSDCMVHYKIDVQTYNNLIGLRDAIDSYDEDHEVNTPKLVTDELIFKRLLCEQAKRNGCDCCINRNARKMIAECMALFV